MQSEEILDRFIGGFRQYQLGEPVSLSFVSQSLCDMTGYTKQELTGDRADADLYGQLVHPLDRERYLGLLHAALAGEGTYRAEYRLVCKNGRVMDVSDTLTVTVAEDGTPVGYATLADITALKAETDSLRFLNETVPCGMLKFTCAKHPKIIYVSDRMLEIMHFPHIKEGEMDYLELYKENIYLMVAMEDRRKFSHFLSQVHAMGGPIAGELSVVRFDGTRAHLYGWVTKVPGADGKAEFQCVCMDVTERYHTKRATQTERYLEALSDVYDRIFEYDFSTKTMRYVYGSRSDVFGNVQNLPMHMEEAGERWINQSVCEEDRPRMQAFFRDILACRASPEGDRPPQIRFRLLTGDGRTQKYSGIFLKIDTAVSLFCCRSMVDEQEADDLRLENLSLKNFNESMQKLVMRFTEGVVAFEVEGDRVKPLYASDNICRFFGYTKEEWLAMADQSRTIKDFIAQSGMSYDEVKQLFATGEAEFTYFDMSTNTRRRIKAICSRKNADGNSSCYVMLYNIDENRGRGGNGAGQSNIYIRTFGYFDVFVDDKPIAFRNKKAKELLALLVDRRGGYVSSEEAISYLWENETVSAVTLARYRKEALRLKNTLEEYGITDIMESVDGKRRIVTEKVRCDLYDYLSQKEEYVQLFKGSYLTNYSWGEVTLGELLNEKTTLS